MYKNSFYYLYMALVKKQMKVFHPTEISIKFCSKVLNFFTCSSDTSCIIQLSVGFIAEYNEYSV